MRKLSFLTLLTVFVFFGCSDDVELKYLLKVSSSTSNGGKVNPAQGAYVPGTNVSITASPSEYYYFKEWEGDVIGDTNPMTIVMDSDKFMTAIFELKDTDGDGITDDIDECPDSYEGAAVDEKGCGLLPDVPVSQTIFLNNPEFINLQVVGGWAYAAGGISGIIVYHNGIDTYVAYERSAPHLSPQSCSQMTVENSLTMECSCDGSVFNILNGASITNDLNYSAKPYKVVKSGNNTLQITNF